MKNLEFDQLLFDANEHLDMLNKMVHEAVIEENLMFQNLLTPTVELLGKTVASYPEMCE